MLAPSRVFQSESEGCENSVQEFVFQPGGPLKAFLDLLEFAKFWVCTPVRRLLLFEEVVHLIDDEKALSRRAFV